MGEEYKLDFIKFLLKTQALKIGGEFNLKSKRVSPYFVNIGDFNDGNSSKFLGEMYAKAIISSGEKIDLLYGIPEKGNALAVSTAIGMANLSNNIPWFFTRKTPKEYGEASNLKPEGRIKTLVVGRAPKEGQSIAQLDDVFTVGNAKYEARDTLLSLGNFNLPLLAIGVDRQEVDIYGKDAIEEYTAKTGTKVVSIVTASDIWQYVRGSYLGSGVVSDEALEQMFNYLRVYGTPKSKHMFVNLEQKIIEEDKSVIPACDVESLEQFENLVKQTSGVDGIGGYKIGFELGLTYGLERVVETVRKHSNKPIIYDHQKAGTDIPDTGKNFARTMKKTGIDTVIFFPQSGPETERAWIYQALNHGLNIIVGGRMTHPAYSVSEGGFITDEGALDIYRIAARAGINNYVVPGNKPDIIKQIREIIESEGISPVFYAPGFIAQGGNITEAAKVAGNKFHGIVGRGIYASNDMKKAALEHTSQLK